MALFTFIILLATLSTLVPYVFCSLAAFLLGERRPGAPARPRRAARRIAALAFVYALVAVGGAGQRGRLSRVPAAARRTARLRVGRHAGAPARRRS